MGWMGARGLRAICESTLQDTMFDIPSDLDIKRVVVTKEAVQGKEGPKLIHSSQSKKVHKRMPKSA